MTAPNAPAIAQVCHDLGGILLAIELAAARVRALAVEQIAARLDDRLRLLTGGGRDRLPRQQTLRAAIDWSYDLLPDVERRVLERMSVFTGAVPLELIEPVVAGNGLESVEVLDAVLRLVDKSLVVPVEQADERWFRLLDTVRVYAAEKLADRGEELATRQRHLGWHLDLAEVAGIVRLGVECEPWIERLRPLEDDVTAATARALDDRRLEQLALGAIEELWWHWWAHFNRTVVQLLRRVEEQAIAYVLTRHPAPDEP